jgi:hypothetical protein
MVKDTSIYTFTKPWRIDAMATIAKIDIGLIGLNA